MVLHAVAFTDADLQARWACWVVVSCRTRTCLHVKQALNLPERNQELGDNQQADAGSASVLSGSPKAGFTCRQDTGAVWDGVHSRTYVGEVAGQAIAGDAGIFGLHKIAHIAVSAQHCALAQASERARPCWAV